MLEKLIRVATICTMTSVLLVAGMSGALYADGELGKAFMSFVK